MAGIKLEDMVGTYIYIGFNEKIVVTGFEPPGPTRLIFVRLTGVDERGVFFEHDKFPLTNKKTGEVEFTRTQVFIPYSKISNISAFPEIRNFDAYTAPENALTFMD